ncbi:MAG TPA: hypothetical protein PKD63_07520 [Solirubrobacteraceae bacterium]|nr:hypothetical protein [Solirubrobacteraceae bacterium]
MGAKVKQAAPAATPAENPWRRFARWSGMSDPEADARLDVESGDEGTQRGPTWLPLALLFALYGLAVLIYILVGRGQALPQVSPDEYQYSAVARSLADGNGLTYNGGSIGIRAALYLYAIAPAWLVTDSLTQSYAIAKAMSAMMLCTVVFPTWLLARRFMPPLVALVPAALMVAGSWMTSSGQLIMENLALPLATASLAALVAALARPGSRWLWLSFLFALLAAWSRAQLAVLIPIILLVLVADIAAQGRDGWRERLRPNRWLLGVTAVITVVGGIAVLSKPSILGSYSGLQAQSDLGRALPLIGRQSLAFIAMSAILPFILALAITLRRRAWDENRLRPLLIAFWVATIVLIIVTGALTTAFVGVDWSIQRYVEYSLPLLYVLVIAGIWQGLIAVRLVALATAFVAAALLLTPQIQNIQEQRGSFGLIRRADELLGASPGLAMALTGLLIGGVAFLIMRSGRATRVWVLTAFVLLTGIVFTVQNQAGWKWQREQSQVWREGFPDDLSWIDNATDRDLARLVTYYNPFRTPQTEFFNRRINRTYVAPGQTPGGTAVNGFTCNWSVASDGALTFGPACGPTPTAFFLNDDIAKLTFYNQTVIAQKPNIGRVVEVEAPPRLKAVVNPPCLAPIRTQDLTTGDINPESVTCAQGAQGTLYLDDPARLVLRFQGGRADQVVQVRGTWEQTPRLITLTAGQTTNITLRPPAGAQQWQVAFDWNGSPPAFPKLESAKLTQGKTTTELLY